jgi:predicted nuclease of predicted toxin-antitoxin system
MQFYLDDCADSKHLVSLLQRAGHSVHTPRSESMTGEDDDVHLAHAAANRYILITKNPDDFEGLHHDWRRQGRAHSGILLIYQDNRHGKDMRPAAIVEAVGKLLASGLPIANELYALNHWR